MDQIARRLMNIHKALHLRYQVDRLYMPRKKEVGLTSIQDSVEASKQWLEDNIKSTEKTDYSYQNNTDNTRRNWAKIARKQRWEEKQLNGHFKQSTSEISQEKIWTQLRKENLTRETESLLIAAQNKAIRRNYFKARIDNTLHNGRYRLYGDWDEMINYLRSKFR